MLYYLGLGSNIGDRKSNLESAVRHLSESGEILQRSSIHETEPVGYLDQPWFLNQVIKFDTQLEPRKLLETVKSIEVRMGRDTPFRNGPRNIDIDILLAGDLNINEPDLIIPHPRMYERDFVMRPLSEIRSEVRQSSSR